MTSVPTRHWRWSWRPSVILTVSHVDADPWYVPTFETIPMTVCSDMTLSILMPIPLCSNIWDHPDDSVFRHDIVNIDADLSFVPPCEFIPMTECSDMTLKMLMLMADLFRPVSSSWWQCSDTTLKMLTPMPHLFWYLRSSRWPVFRRDIGSVDADPSFLPTFETIPMTECSDMTLAILMLIPLCSDIWDHPNDSVPTWH